MPNDNKPKQEHVFIQCWEHEETTDYKEMMFEITDRQQFLRAQVKYAGVVRGNITVTVYSCYYHGQPDIPKEIMRDIAQFYLDGNYNVINVDLGER